MESARPAPAGGVGRRDVGVVHRRGGVRSAADRARRRRRPRHRPRRGALAHVRTVVAEPRSPRRPRSSCSATPRSTPARPTPGRCSTSCSSGDGGPQPDETPRLIVQMLDDEHARARRAHRARRLPDQRGARQPVHRTAHRTARTPGIPPRAVRRRPCVDPPGRDATASTWWAPSRRRHLHRRLRGGRARDRVATHCRPAAVMLNPNASDRVTLAADDEIVSSAEQPRDGCSGLRSSRRRGDRR